MIRLEINTADVIESLMQYTKEVEAKSGKVLRELTNLGSAVATMGFKTAQYDGTNDVQVTPNLISSRESEIVAQGNAVCFIEFGTGVHYAEPYLGNVPSGIVDIGQYGNYHGNEDEWAYPIEKGAGTEGREHGKWYLTHGNPPAMAMYNASREIKEKARTIKW